MFIESDRKRRTIRITVWVAVLGLLLGVLSSIIGAVSADAHAALKSVTPADRSTVKAPPRAVTLEFNEPIGTSFATVTVTGPSGPVGDGRPEVDGTTVTQKLDGNLPDGAYTVTFRVVSEDGHPVSDTSKFTLVAAPATSASTTASSPSSDPTMTTGAPAAPSTTSPSATSPSAATTPGESPSTTTSSTTDNGSVTRLGLAFGVGALALAAGVGLVAVTRRRGRS